jgi:hypothetical protein
MAEGVHVRFYKLNEIPISRDDKIFKAAPLYTSIPVVLFLAIGIAGLVIGIRGGIKAQGHFNGVSAEGGYWFGGTFIVMGLLFLGMLRANLKSTNWLFRFSSTGVIIKYRSYLNWRLPADGVQAVGFSYSEIACVRKAKLRRTSPRMSGGETTEYLTCLDFCLINPDTSELEKHLEEERNRKCNPLYLSYPVEVIGGGIVRIRWKGLADYFLPDRDKAIKWLSQYVRIAPADSLKTDFTRNKKASRAEEDDKIYDLGRDGNKMGAIELTRQIYGCSLTEAVKFVEKLQSDQNSI